jgi:hypothetical protein
MDFIRRLFSDSEGPSERQISRGLKQVIQTHGDPATRVAAMQRLASWRTAEAASALLRRFTVQVPQETMDLEEKQYTVRLLTEMGRVAVEPILNYLRAEADVTWPVRALRASALAGCSAPLCSPRASARPKSASARSSLTPAASSGKAARIWRSTNATSPCTKMNWPPPASAFFGRVCAAPGVDHPGKRRLRIVFCDRIRGRLGLSSLRGLRFGFVCGIIRRDTAKESLLGDRRGGGGFTCP